jgi:hypothetical protein
VTATLIGGGVSCSGGDSAPTSKPEQATTTTISPQEKFDKSIKGKLLWPFSAPTVRVDPKEVCAQGKPGEQPFMDTDEGVTSDRKTWKKAQALIVAGSDVAQADTQQMISEGKLFGAVWVEPGSQDRDGKGVTGGAALATFSEPVTPNNVYLYRATAARIGDGLGCFAGAIGHAGEDGIPVIDKVMPTSFYGISISYAESQGML